MLNLKLEFLQFDCKEFALYIRKKCYPLDHKREQLIHASLVSAQWKLTQITNRLKESSSFKELNSSLSEVRLFDYINGLLKVSEYDRLLMENISLMESFSKKVISDYKTFQKLESTLLRLISVIEKIDTEKFVANELKEMEKFLTSLEVKKRVNKENQVGTTVNW